MIDIWSLPHLAAGYLFGRYTDLNILQFSVINVGFEVFETLLKRQPSINAVSDATVTTGGFIAGQQTKYIFYRPMIDYMEQNCHHELVGAEIGVFNGDNARRMLQRLPIRHLYLVDPYIDYQGYQAKLNLEKMFSLDASLYAAQRKLAPHSDKISFILKKSEDAVYDIPNDLDFVYIDGNHSYEYVLRDIELYYPKVRYGGIIGGHDIFCDDVRRAVEDFSRINNLPRYIKNPDWWIIKARIQTPILS